MAKLLTTVIMAIMCGGGAGHEQDSCALILRGSHELVAETATELGQHFRWSELAFMLTFTLIFGIFLGVFCTLKAQTCIRKFWPAAAAVAAAATRPLQDRRDEIVVHKKSVWTQSQTSYTITLNKTQQRFTPLAEFNQGAWR